jgi:uncharacterized coiled-coil DUF342 family protein
MRAVAIALDAELKGRLRSVLDDERVTEAELRKLTEEGAACARLVKAQLARAEETLAALSSDPASSLTDIAAALRAVNELRPDLDELHELLDELNGRAREVRRAWVAS